MRKRLSPSKQHKRWAIVVLLFCSQVLWADHFPPGKIAVGTPEHVLSGVNVYQDTMQDVIKRLGKPVQVTTQTNPDYPLGSGEHTYKWNLKGYRLSIGTEFRTDAASHRLIEGPPIIVDIWGSRKGSTGQGLSLGEKISDIERDYGTRFQRDPHGVRIQWKDETTLIIDFNSRGIITHMQLMPEME